ncbi:MAG: hypothetical protein VW496_02350 [Pelagibacteraceae bacterium]
MFELVQTDLKDSKVHESDLLEEDITDVIDSYDSLFNSMGFTTVVSVSDQTKLPIIKVVDNGIIRAKLWFRKEQSHADPQKSHGEY